MARQRLPAALCAVVLLLVSVLLAPAAVAAPAPRASDVELSGICPWLDGASKEVRAELRGAHLLTPYLLYDEGGWTGATLTPYEVTASGEGLKSRHLQPGVYTRSGPVPSDAVTCTFSGTSADGPVSLVVVGTVRLNPSVRH